MSDALISFSPGPTGESGDDGTREVVLGDDSG
jgi:hypothetical protein